jgi:hypothetical protein
MTATQQTSVRLLGKLAALLATQGISSRQTIRTLAWRCGGWDYSARVRADRGGWVVIFEKTRDYETMRTVRDVWLADEGDFDHATHDILRAATGN